VDAALNALYLHMSVHMCLWGRAVQDTSSTACLPVKVVNMLVSVLLAAAEHGKRQLEPSLASWCSAHPTSPLAPGPLVPPRGGGGLNLVTSRLRAYLQQRPAAATKCRREHCVMQNRGWQRQDRHTHACLPRCALHIPTNITAWSPQEGACSSSQISETNPATKQGRPRHSLAAASPSLKNC